MTRRVAASEQGQLQGAGSSIMGIAGLIGPGLFSEIFARFVDPDAQFRLPGAPYFLAGAMMLVAVSLAWRVTRKRPAEVVHVG
jgi:DHA1 family tetracycline resistance protein-like MFS transporter